MKIIVRLLVYLFDNLVNYIVNQFALKVMYIFLKNQRIFITAFFCLYVEIPSFTEIKATFI
jgi:hypothetical protein